MKKQTMWLVDEQLHINNVDVIFDGKKPVYFIFLDEDEDLTAYHLDDNDHLFTSKGEADKYADERRQQIMDKMADVKKFIERMSCIDMGDYKFEEKDYLGWKSGSNYYEKECDRMNKLNRMYRNYILRGIINLDAWTFKHADVKAVKWCKKGNEYFARLILNDDTEVRTRSGVEYDFITEIYGDNETERIFIE